jgi:aspartate 1-decarboxylase
MMYFKKGGYTMFVELCKSKIGNAFVTEKSLHYEGSISISEDIAEKALLYPDEKVLVINVNNGERFETYVIIGERGKGIIGLNGGAARKGEIGDELIVLSFAMYDEEEAKKQKMLVLRLKEGNTLPDADS